MKEIVRYVSFGHLIIILNIQAGKSYYEIFPLFLFYIKKNLEKGVKICLYF